MLWQRWACHLGLIGFLAMAAEGSLGAAGFYVSRSWGDEQGVDLSMANAVAQTSDGYLWVGTPAGLYRFNGVEFVPIEPRPSQSPQVALNVTALWADRTGGLWIGSLAEGLWFHRDGKFQSFGAGQGLTNDRIKAVFEDRDGGVWVATDGGGAYRRTGERFEPLAFENGAAPRFPTAWAQDKSGTMWMGTFNDGLYRFRDQRIEEVLAPVPTIKGVAITSDGLMWVATSAGLSRVIEGRLERVPLPRGDGSMAERVFVTSLAAGPDGSLWVGTVTGLCRLRQGVWERFGRDEGLGNGLVTTVFVDREESVWVGVEVGSLHQFTRRQVRLLEPYDGRLQAVNSLCVDRTGRLWVGGSLGLVAFKDGRRVWSPAPGDLAAEEISAVGEDAAGRIWFATRFGDWGWWQDGKVERVPWPAQRGARSWVILFFRTLRGEFWAGLADGLLRLQPEDRRVRFDDDQLAHRQILSACEDGTGALWVGTGHGLSRWQDGVFENFNDLVPRALDVVTSLHADVEGTVWIGTGGGLWRHRAGQFFAFGPEHGVPPTIGQIIEDDHDHLWLTWGEGVTRIARAELNAVAEGAAERVAGWVLGRSAGVRSVLISTGRSAAKLADGLLAFATDRGLILIDPVELPRNDRSPPVAIERFILNGEPLTPSASGAGRALRLPPGYHRLEIHYAGLSFLDPTQVRFRHRLRGLSDQWEEVGPGRVAQFRALPPGRYDFELQAAQTASDWSPVAATVGIEVRSPWWQSTGFRTAVAGSVLGLLGGGYLLRVRRLERQSLARRDFSLRLLEREEHERRRLARELHDGLGQDLLILKNRVAWLEQRLPPEREDLRRQAGEIAEASQAAIEGARAIAYNLRPADLDRAGLTRSLRAMLDRAAAGSSLTLDRDLEEVDGWLTPEADVVLYRIAQELIHNVLKHARATRALVDLRRTPEGIELVVSDDGCGFDPDQVQERSGPAKGLGLDSIEERVAMLRGEIRMESAPGQGTRFRITLPRA
jgi:signal transduction histidine kinase/ligand-binding sensor domain-containing protein